MDLPIPLRIPFEDRDAFPSFGQRLGLTLRLAFTDPLEFCRRIPAGDGLTAPWRLMLLLSLPLYALLLIYVAVIATLLAVFLVAPPPDLAPAVPWILGGLLLCILATPLFQLLGFLAHGVVFHLFFWAWGGTGRGKGLRTSLRAAGYATAFSAPLCLIPVFGLVVPIALWILMGAGLARANGKATWRGIAAAASQVLLCAVFVIAALVLLIAGLVIADQKSRVIPPPAPMGEAPSEPEVPQPPPGRA